MHEKKWKLFFLSLSLTDSIVEQVKCENKRKEERTVN